MLKKVAATIKWSPWAKRDPRFQRFETLDRVLDGKIYDHLPFAFDQETDHLGQYIPKDKRRPATPHNIPRWVSKVLARKVFGGRNKPKIAHDDDALRAVVLALTQEARLPKKMLTAAIWASVGAAAITFKVLVDKSTKRAKLVAVVHRAKWCRPRFDAFEELSGLRVQKVVEGYSLTEIGIDADYKNKAIDPSCQYWFIRDYGRQEEITYKPIKVHDWNPNNPDDAKKLIESEKHAHGLGFVPAEWITTPESECIFEPAVPMCIQADYSMSFVGRAVDYNASPQIVTQGNLKNWGESESGEQIIRGPANMLAFEAAQKDLDGQTIGGGDAKLLEMTGQGIEKSIDFVDKLVDRALAQICASRKDPTTLKGDMSGRAMELLDEDFFNLVQELRECWGDEAYLSLIKKMLKACVLAKHPLVLDRAWSDKDIDGLKLNWPKFSTLTPAEHLATSQALALAIETTTPGTEGSPATTTGWIPKEEVEEFYRAQLDFDEDSADKEDLLPETDSDSDESDDELPSVDPPAVEKV